jgi:hypothetical protein
MMKFLIIPGVTETVGGQIWVEDAARRRSDEIFKRNPRKRR